MAKCASRTIGKGTRMTKAQTSFLLAVAAALTGFALHTVPMFLQDLYGYSRIDGYHWRTDPGFALFALIGACVVWIVLLIRALQPLRSRLSAARFVGDGLLLGAIIAFASWLFSQQMKRTL